MLVKQKETHISYVNCVSKVIKIINFGKQIEYDKREMQMNGREKKRKTNVKNPFEVKCAGKNFRKHKPLLCTFLVWDAKTLTGKCKYTKIVSFGQWQTQIQNPGSKLTE